MKRARIDPELLRVIQQAHEEVENGPAWRRQLRDQNIEALRWREARRNGELYR